MAALIVLVWIVSTVAGWWIGRTKAREREGVLLGLFLGLIGIVIIALLPDGHVPTPAKDRYWEPWPEDPMARLKAEYDRGRISETDYVRGMGELRANKR